MAEYKRRRNVYERLIESSNIGLVLANPVHSLNGILGDEIPMRSDLVMSDSEYQKDGTMRLGAEPKRAQISRIGKMYTCITDRFMYLGSVNRYRSIYADDFVKTSGVSERGMGGLCPRTSISTYNSY